MRHVWKTVIVLSVVFMISLSIPLYAENGYVVVPGVSISLKFTPMVLRVCGDKMIVVGFDKDSKEHIAIFSLKDPDKPRFESEKMLGSRIDDITDVVCHDGKIFILRNRHGMEILTADGLSILKCRADWYGLTGAVFRNALYTITPFLGDGLMWRYDSSGKYKVEIDYGDMPPLLRSMEYPEAIVPLKDGRIILAGQGLMILKMQDDTHATVVSYVNIDPTSGGEPIYFGRRPQMIDGILYGWGKDGDVGKLYFYDTVSGKYGYKDVEKLHEVGSMASFGHVIYAITAGSEGIYKELSIYDTRSNSLYIAKENGKFRDIGVYLGRVYVAGEKDVEIYNSSLFTDMSPDYWAYDAAAYLVSAGVISGYPDGSFKPDKPVSRAEYAKMLTVVMKLDVRPCSGWHVFKDVADDRWYCPYVRAVYETGYMVGMGKGIFAPGERVKKEEILTTIVRIRGWELIRPDTPTFSDIPKNYWAYPYVEAAVKHGIIGVNDRGLTQGTTFGKGEPSSRAQTAVLIYRGLYNEDSH